jgi:uncharacterized protein YcbK (DUF882 family)
MLEYLDNITSPEELTGGNLQKLDRRSLLKMGLVGILASVVPLLPSASALAASKKSAWRVSMRHQHTGETFSGVYRVGDQYLPDAFERLNYVLRDFRTGEAFPMDPRAIDIVSILQARTKTGRPFDVLSGYRSPKTNAMLRHASGGVAKNSLHMYGQAIDIRMPGFSTKKLIGMARGLKAGGVGYYPRSDFMHVDTGIVRSW